MSAAATTTAVAQVAWPTDVDGVYVEVTDVVGGDAGEATVDELASLHAAAFPDYPFLAAEIRADADADPRRERLVVHQWLVHCAGAPVALMLFDSNLARRVAPVHFLAVTRSGRAVRVGGHRLSAWLCRQALATLTAELAAHSPGATPLGVVGESAGRAIRLWHGVGFRPVDVPYAEPAAGRHWRAAGDATMRPLTLLWLPPAGADATIAAVAGPAGAAAFLIDHYALPPDHPTVVASVGPELHRPGATGR